MKIRTGFVSNSSSTAFIFIIEKDWYDQCFNESNDYVQHIIRYTLPFNIQVLGRSCMVLQGFYDAEGSFFRDFPDHASEKALWDEDSQLYIDAEDKEVDVIANRHEALTTFKDLCKRDDTKTWIHSLQT